MNSIAHCPGCGTVSPFRHADTRIYTCTCGTVSVREEDGGLRSKPYPIVREQDSPVRICTEGVWEGNSFAVIGRFRCWFEEIVYNYWTVLYADGTLGYLAEGYGLYAMYSPVSLDLALSKTKLNALKPGDTEALRMGSQFVLERMYTCESWEVEGEVWMPESDSSFATYEWANDDLERTRIEIVAFMPALLRAYSVKYVSFGDLNLTHLHSTPPPPKTFVCTDCNLTHPWHGYPYTQSFGCGQCGSWWALEGGAIVRKSRNNPTQYAPAFAPGITSSVKGVDYTVVGYATKKQNRDDALWREYTLYNWEEGYAFLSEYNGHWMYVRERGDAPVARNEKERTFEYNGEEYALFIHYGFSNVVAIGAFPGNVFNDSKKHAWEYIAPPHIWIREKDVKEGYVSFRGEHMGKGEMQAAVPGAVFEYRHGVGALQPALIKKPKSILAALGLAAVALIVIHFLAAALLQNRTLLNETFSFADSAAQQQEVAGPFVLSKRKSNVTLEIFAPVNNSWFELGAVLVNTATGTEYSLEQGVEYYYGVDEGYSWDEGDRSQTAYFNSIPAGTYLLQLTGFCAPPDYQTGKPAVESFSVKAIYDTPNHRNLIWCLLILAIFPLIQYGIAYQTDRERWRHSPFSPYTYDNG